MKTLARLIEMTMIRLYK